MTRMMNYRTMQVCGTFLFLRAQSKIGLHHGLPAQMVAAPGVVAAPGGDHYLSSTPYREAISQRHPKIRPRHPA